jgi:acyl-CoA thioesterase-2
MSDGNTAEHALGAVLRQLDVAPSGPNAFSAGAAANGRSRLFGGLVAGQATVAAARTVPGLPLHSLHAYFLQPGDPQLAVDYEVVLLKQGKNFQARQVLGRQGDNCIFSLQASFTRPESGIEHSQAMPEAEAPEALSDTVFGLWGAQSPVRVRDCDAGNWERAAARGMRRLWMRPAAPLPEDPTLHLGMLVFASDMSFVMTGMLHHLALRERPRTGASLDHALWLHRPICFDDWLLYTMESPVAHAGRPLITGAFYRRDGVRVASVAQEGLMRFRS